MVSREVELFNVAIDVTGEALRQSQPGPVDPELRRRATAGVLAIVDPNEFIKRAQDKRGARENVETVLRLGAEALGFELVKKGK